jgi:hypothetical protein
VIDRESTFADPEIVSFIKTKTVPVAIDQWNQRRQKDSEGDFYRKIAGQGPRNDFDGTTQGLYLAAPDGTLLGYTNNRNPDRVMQFFKESMAKFRPANTKALAVETEDRKYVIRPPEGGLVIRVQAKVLDGYEQTDDKFIQIFQAAVSRDNLWITAAEQQQLAAGKFPERLTVRIARHCLVDNTRGEAPAWKEADIVSAKIKITGGKITGHCEMKLADGSRSYSADVLGEIEFKDSHVSTLNMVAKGMYFGSGPYTPNAPKGKFPLAVSFTLADGKDIADAVPPEGARGWVADYLR